MVGWIRAFLAFWYDFIVGDDWTVAAAITVALVVLALVVHAHANAWWLLPLVVIASLGFSLQRATRSG